MRKRIPMSIVCGAVLALALFGGAGCGHRDEADSTSANSQPGGPALSPEQRSAMQAQRQSMAADRAAHAQQRK